MNRRKKTEHSHISPHRYNRRHDGVLTVSSDKDRHELEEARLRKQWEKTVVKSAVPTTPLIPTTTTLTSITPVTLRPGKEVFRG